MAQRQGPGPGQSVPGEFGRRTFLRGVSLSALAVAGGGLLSSCGTPGAIVPAGSCVSHDRSATEKTLQFDNWPQYIDPTTSKLPSTLDKFEEATGISVTYIADVNDNESFFAKVADQLARCTSTSKDMFVLTDWMAGKMISLGWLQKLDHSKMPNVTKNLLPSLQAPLLGPAPRLQRAVAERDDRNLLQLRAHRPCPQLRGAADPPGPQGQDRPADRDARHDAVHAADRRGGPGRLHAAPSSRRASSGWRRRSTTVRYGVSPATTTSTTCRSGNVVACESWSGDIPQLGDPKFKWIAPEEGFAVWSDNMLVPNLSPHKANAEALMNFYYQPEIAAQLEAWNYYFCPVVGCRRVHRRVRQGRGRTIR